jgi:hypothetical protein
MEPKEQRRVDKFILFGMAAGIDAMEDSGWKPESEEEQYRAGVMMGSGIGGLQTIYENSVIINENKSTHRVSPFFIPSCLINMISGNLSIRFGLKGPNHACVTACSTGTHAIGDAAAMIVRGDADLMLADHPEENKLVNPALFLRFHHRIRVKPVRFFAHRHLAGNFDRHVIQFKIFINSSDCRLSGNNVFPVIVNASAKGSQHSHSGYNYSSHRISLKLNWYFS